MFHVYTRIQKEKIQLICLKKKKNQKNEKGYVKVGNWKILENVCSGARLDATDVRCVGRVTGKRGGRE